eukprot:2280078-Karenia_brevis.AAC.1
MAQYFYRPNSGQRSDGLHLNYCTVGGCGKLLTWLDDHRPVDLAAQFVPTHGQYRCTCTVAGIYLCLTISVSSSCKHVVHEGSDAMVMSLHTSTKSRPGRLRG